MVSLPTSRKVGDRDPISIVVTFPSTTDLTSLPVAFWMSTTADVPKITGSAATAVDITPVGATAKTMWRLSYAFAASDLDIAGTYKAEFSVDYGGGQKRYYPRGSSFIVIDVVRHPASL